jgi:hypothetical protein
MNNFLGLKTGGDMRPRGGISWGLVLAALLVLPTAVQAEMFIEGYMGGVAGGGAGTSTSRNFVSPGPTVSTPTGFLPGGAQFSYPTTVMGSTGAAFDGISPAFVGGLKLGAWFEQSGVLAGVNFPSWMKYFGFYLDFKFHRLDIDKQDAPVNVNIAGGSGGRYFFPPGTPVDWESSVFGGQGNVATCWTEGKAATIAFMFAARYGLYPDSEVPFGRLQPYVAVGPAIMIVNQDPAIVVNPANLDATQTTTYNYLGIITTTTQNLAVGGIPSQSSKFHSGLTVAAALAVDAGFRYMALRNVSLDIFFNYRYAQPSFSYNAINPLFGSFDFKPTFHLFMGGLGAAYHF